MSRVRPAALPPLHAPPQSRAFPLLDLPVELLLCVLDRLPLATRQAVRATCRALCATAPVPHAAIYRGLTVRAYCAALWAQVTLATTGNLQRDFCTHEPRTMTAKLTRSEYNRIRCLLRDAVRQQPRTRAELENLLAMLRLSVTRTPVGGARMGLALRTLDTRTGFADCVTLSNLCQLSAAHMAGAGNPVPFLTRGPLAPSLVEGAWPAVDLALLEPPAGWTPTMAPPDRPVARPAPPLISVAAAMDDDASGETLGSEDTSDSSAGSSSADDSFVDGDEDDDSDGDSAVPEDDDADSSSD